jgi:hypothetical protein
MIYKVCAKERAPASDCPCSLHACGGGTLHRSLLTFLVRSQTCHPARFCTGNKDQSGPAVLWGYKGDVFGPDGGRLSGLVQTLPHPTPGRRAARAAAYTHEARSHAERALIFTGVQGCRAAPASWPAHRTPPRPEAGAWVCAAESMHTVLKAHCRPHYLWQCK